MALPSTSVHVLLFSSHSTTGASDTSARAAPGVRVGQPAPKAASKGWLPDQANRFCATNRGVAIETREITYLNNPRTADSFLASAVCGGPSESQISVFRARVYATSSLACMGVHAPTCPLFYLRYSPPPKEHVGRLVGRCVPRDSGCVPRQSFSDGHQPTTSLLITFKKKRNTQFK